MVAQKEFFIPKSQLFANKTRLLPLLAASLYLEIPSALHRPLPLRGTYLQVCFTECGDRSTCRGSQLSTEFCSTISVALCARTILSPESMKVNRDRPLVRKLPSRTSPRRRNIKRRAQSVPYTLRAPIPILKHSDRPLTLPTRIYEMPRFMMCLRRRGVRKLLLSKGILVEQR